MSGSAFISSSFGGGGGGRTAGDMRGLGDGGDGAASFETAVGGCRVDPEASIVLVAGGGAGTSVDVGERGGATGLSTGTGGATAVWDVDEVGALLDDEEGVAFLVLVNGFGPLGREIGRMGGVSGGDGAAATAGATGGTPAR